ncbi:MAG: MFS transporter [Deltaproteobacteria bacterium]|nr:MFS transporter [Deltaproteobacteria bacterium]
MTEKLSGREGGYYRWLVVAALFLVWTVVFGIQYSFGIFVRHLQEGLGCSRGTISLAMTFHLLVFALTMVPAGWAISRFRARTLYSLAAFGLGPPLALCGLVSEPWQLYLLYGLMGVSISTYGPTIFTVIASWFTAQRGLALGLASAGSGLGTLIAAPVANALINVWGWRSAFAILGLASFAILLLVSQLVRNPPDWRPAGGANGPGIDPEPPRTSLRQVMGTQEIRLIVAGSMSAQIASRVIVVHIAPHAMDVGLSALAAAMALSIVGFGSLVGRILMGFVQDRIGARLSMILCLLIMGVSLALLPLARTDAALFAFAVLFGFAFGGDVPQVPALTVRCFGVSALGVVYGTISAVVNVGSGLAPAAAGYIFDWAGSYTAAFLGASILLFFGAGAIFRIR